MKKAFNKWSQYPAEEIEWPKQLSWPAPAEIAERQARNEAWQIEWKRRQKLDCVWLDYTTHEGAPQDFNWECKNCGTRNYEGADVDDNYYSILECDTCGTDYRIIDPR